MLYYLLTVLSETSFGVAKYISVRSILGMLSALFISFLISPWFIRRLQLSQIGQVVRDDGPKSHFSKKGTPTMGGALILFAILLSSLLWTNLGNIYFWLTSLLALVYGALGFVDDYQKVTKKNSKGVSGKTKLRVQIVAAFIVTLIYYFVEPTASTITIPFLKDTYIDMGPLYLLFGTFVIVGASNSVNLTDGLDGLAIGPVMISALCFGILSYVSGHYYVAQYLKLPYIQGSGELCVFASAMIGAGLGFLWYNAYPAQVFMGDIGSLPLGGMLGALAIFSKQEILLVIIGGIFVLEAISVITQVASFKLFGKRIFKMAPIHHHFELKGWPEPKVIVRFWIISIILGLFGLLSLKIR